MKGYIYKITNIINGKIYIGKTEETIERRFYEHKLSVKTSKKQNKLYSAMKHYGIDSFIIEEIDQANSKEELCEKEKYWINKLNSRDDNIGYNISKGGDGGYTWDQRGTVTLHKDDKNTHVYPNLVEEYLLNGWSLGGKKLGEAKKKFRWVTNGDIQKRVPIDDLNIWLNSGWKIGYGNRSKKNLSDSHKGKSPYNKGKHLSNEQREKLSKLYKNSRWMNNGTKSLLVKENDIEYYLNIGYAFGRMIGGDK